ncbi:MAG: 2-oxoacid:acceptor oxidoreductase family protein [Candidatus Cloacimonetes bacterium]|nr:2-oxoacid:acceptor oxidoreductase family protein [Candidatus Cloacimonadota bacterium]
MRNEIRLSGSGGQGLITAGVILAKAALLDGNLVTQTQSYGPESRGGASRADVLISDEDVYFPEAVNLDVLMVLTQKACDKYLYDMKDTGILIADNTQVKNISLTSHNIYEMPVTEIATEKLGTVLPTNILSLSYLVKITGIVTPESLRKAIRDTVKPAYVELNLKAMKLGMKLAEKSQQETER